jgi:Skp family chaperone for outer membrane proteins
MKSNCGKLLPVFALAFLMALPALAQNKIATINLQKTFDRYYKTEQAKLVMAKQKEDMDKDLQALLNEAKSKSDELAALQKDIDDPVITSEERSKRREKAQKKFEEKTYAENMFVSARDQGFAKLDNDRKRLLEVILKEIRTAVNAEARKSNYAKVLDVSEDGWGGLPPAVLYTNGDDDITETIIKQINAGAPISVTPAATNKPTEKPDKAK